MLPEHLRALIVIITLAGVVFFLAERVLCPALVSREDLHRRRNLWFAVTLASFLLHSFWLVMLFVAAVAFVTAKRDPSPFALYLTVLFAVPWWSSDVPGFGVFNYLVSLNYYKVLNLAVLLPLAASLIHRGSRPKQLQIADTLLLMYLAYCLVRSAIPLGLTGLIRKSFDLGVEIWLPYFCASRALIQIGALRNAVASVVVAAAVLAAIAPFEALRGWHLYESLRPALGLPPHELTVYILRGDGGLLRPVGSVGNSIALGYLLMVALLLSRYISSLLANRKFRLLLGTSLALGLAASLSRGPWVGAVIGLFASLAAGPQAIRLLMKAASIAIVFGSSLLLIPGGERIIELLPFVGSVESENITYRALLFELSIRVFWIEPIFGSLDYLMHPQMEQLRQGQGIIDMVNSYLAVALPLGLVGLLLFCAPFGYALWCCVIPLRGRGQHTTEAKLMGAVFFGTLLAILFTIATVSSISIIAPVYWIFTGLCVAYSIAATASPTSTDRTVRDAVPDATSARGSPKQ